MGLSTVQMVCLALGVLGRVWMVICCVVPRWKVTHFIGVNKTMTETTMQGLWNWCVVECSGQELCKNYKSLKAMSSDLQAARAMTFISCTVSAFSLFSLVFGAYFPTFVQKQDATPKNSVVPGLGLVLSGLLMIASVRWSMYFALGKFGNSLIEMGECIYFGWIAGVLMVLAGGLLCYFSRPTSSSSGGTTDEHVHIAAAPSNDRQ
ncbi:claudin-4-like [Poeciliopsis prolifica]|uniref:claudin-4-like n=1 Tax=Poeciliopsis prolifica TaxID=188132 RepID=UPI002413C898|nr:claudin-4-like [Poeciliopsis prolifica]XP_054907764.1 claudin-4-like [Poeciliopsis prolifica]